MFRITYTSFFSFLSNVKILSDHLRSSDLDETLIPSFNYSNPTSVAVEDYSVWFKQHGNKIPGNLTECDLEKEMQKVTFAVRDSFFFCMWCAVHEN